MEISVDAQVTKLSNCSCELLKYSFLNLGYRPILDAMKSFAVDVKNPVHSDIEVKCLEGFFLFLFVKFMRT